MASASFSSPSPGDYIQLSFTEHYCVPNATLCVLYTFPCNLCDMESLILFYVRSLMLTGIFTGLSDHGVCFFILSLGFLSAAPRCLNLCRREIHAEAHTAGTAQSALSAYLGSFTRFFKKIVFILFYICVCLVPMEARKS